LIRLGDLYAGGDAGPVEAEAAIRAYETAATLGEARALLRLGDLYRDGVVVPADGDRALRYYHLATNPALGLLRVHSL
jgi:TPR repeat protein